MTRLSRKDWKELDRLLGLHGWSGYYDLVETLKIIAGNLGITNTGVELYPETGGWGLESLSLPQVVSYLSDWSSILSHQEGFPELAVEASKDVERKGGIP